MGIYPEYKNLKLDWPAPYVLRLTFSRGKANTMDYELHRDIAEIWRIIDSDPDVGAVIVTGEGRFFSGGVQFESGSAMREDWDLMLRLLKDARGIVENMIACNKPIIAAINGPAAGAGLAVALMCDITLMARSAKIVDAHTRLGVSAGDHSALMWPLLCGMAKAKYYLFTCDPIPAEEAERIGLISQVYDDDKLMAEAEALATRLAQGAPSAIRWTKQALNGWLRMAWPIYEASQVNSVLGFFGPEYAEGVSSLLEKRPANFNPRSSA